MRKTMKKQSENSMPENMTNIKEENLMQIGKVELVKDYFGREYWKISAPDGRWIKFAVHIGWTKQTAMEAFQNRFEYLMENF